MSRVARKTKTKFKFSNINKAKVLIEITAIIFVALKLYNVIDVSWWYLSLLVLLFNNVHYSSRKVIKSKSQ